MPLFDRRIEILAGGIWAENKAPSRRGRCYDDAFESRDKNYRQNLQVSQELNEILHFFFNNVFITSYLFIPADSFFSQVMLQLRLYI